MPKISIIIPTWNRENLIQNAIKSVQNQTIKDIEILVCDDGSTDNTEKIIKKISKIDTRVRWIKGKHSGRPAVPRNNGIKNAEGEWIAFLDSDDEWLPQKLEKQLKILKNSNSKASSTNAYRVLPQNNKKNIFYKEYKATINFKDLLMSNKIICSSVVLHKSLFKKIINFPIGDKIIEDYALWIRVATQTNFNTINEPLLIYRDNIQDSIREKDINDIFEQKKYIFKNFLKWAKKNNISYEYKLKIYFKNIKNYYEIKIKILKKIIKKLLKT